ncbi:MAG: hypothetical protein ACLP0H_07080 [Terriglobales bacterium]
MKKCASTVGFILSLLFAVSAWSQDDNVVQLLGSAQDDSSQSAPYDEVATPGQIHGFIPDTWTAGMITLADLQTQEGQDWLNGLTAAQSAQAQTQYVCQNPGPTTTSSSTGDFYFYDLPAGSYAIGACMQTPDGHWRSGAQVLSLDAGQDELVALGSSGRPLMRAGEPFVPVYYLGLGEPMWFGPEWAWGWHPSLAWRASFYYHAPLYRSSPIWIRPLHVAVDIRLVVPPYKEVIAGNYHYVAFRHGTYVRESPHPGYVAPPKHVFHPVTPDMEVRRMHEAAQNRPPVAINVPASPVPHPQPTAAANPSKFQNQHPMPAVANTSQRGTAYHPAAVNSSQSHTQTKPQFSGQQSQTGSRPPSRQSEPAPHPDAHASPSTQPKPAAPARKK